MTCKMAYVSHIEYGIRADLDLRGSGHARFAVLVWLEYKSCQTANLHKQFIMRSLEGIRTKEGINRKFNE